MTSAQRERAEGFSARSEQAWDDELRSIGGHMLQSWRWGDFKSRHGWDVERVSVHGARPGETAMAQVLIRRRGPLGLAYVPRGPAFGPSGQAIADPLFRAVDAMCRTRRCLNLIVEPDEPLPFSGRYKDHGFVRGPVHFQPARSVVVPLLDDDALLAQMRQKTRYSVRLAQRRGVEIRREPSTDAAVAGFHALLAETSDRNEFGIHHAEYYGDFLRTFGESGILLFAYVENQPAAAVIAARFGDAASYMYGASSTTHRAHGAAFALQFEAMRWARDSGCKTYDLWGIPLEQPDPMQGNGDRVAPSRGDDWRGLSRFKTGFGGEIVTYPPTLERRYRPVLSFVARRLYANRGG